MIITMYQIQPKPKIVCINFYCASTLTFAKKINLILRISSVLCSSQNQRK